MLSPTQPSDGRAGTHQPPWQRQVSQPPRTGMGGLSPSDARRLLSARPCRCPGTERGRQNPPKPPATHGVLLSPASQEDISQPVPDRRWKPPAPELPVPTAVERGGWAGAVPHHPPREPPPQRGSGAGCGTQRTSVFTGFLLFFLKQTPINVNITDVNKHDPKTQVQLYITGEKEGRREEKHFN